MRIREKAFIFIIMVILGIGLSLVTELSAGTREKVMSSTEFRNAIDHKTRLLKEIRNLDAKNKEKEEKLYSYRFTTEVSGKVLEGIEKELKKNNLLSGYSDIEGPGIVITLSDGVMTTGEDKDDMLNYLRTIHNTDMLRIINELKLNGAEAIAINGQRVLETSEIYCSWAFITINNVKLPAPFIIEVIGDSTSLDTYTKSDFGYVRMLGYRGVNISVDKLEKVMIPGVEAASRPQYLKPAVQTSK